MAGVIFDGGVGPMVISVPFSVTANATVYTGAFICNTTYNGAFQLDRAEMVFYSAPVTSGTVTAALSNRDSSASATDNLLSAATQTVSTATSLVAFALTLTTTLADLKLGNADYIFLTMVSDNADMTGATGGVLTLTLNPIL